MGAPWREDREVEKREGIRGDWHPHRAGGEIDIKGCADRMIGKVEAAKAYLRARGKYVGDTECGFRPTPSTDHFSIIERYGRPVEKAGRPMEGS